MADKNVYGGRGGSAAAPRPKSVVAIQKNIAAGDRALADFGKYLTLTAPQQAAAKTAAATAKTSAAATAASKKSAARGMEQAAAKAVAKPKVTPADIMATIKKPSLTAGGLAASAAPKPFAAQDLYADPASIYAPAVSQLEQQTAAANERYAKNQASIKNIFGSLSDLSQKDALRIQDQFKATIASQQANLAARTAAAQTAGAAGAAQAVATGAERGAGPAMAESPAQQATAEGIGRSNEYQTTWEALQNANASQAVVDATSRQTGYGQQQVGALQQLQQNLEDKLLQIGGNETAVQQDIAKARYAAQQQVRDTLYNEQQQKMAASAGGGGGAASAKAKSYPKSIYGLEQRVIDEAKDATAFTSLKGSVVNAVKRATAAATATAGKPAKPTKAQVFQAWNSPDIGGSAKYATYAQDYINNYAGLSS